MISYPKSGRTWVRLMLNTYMVKQHKLPIDDVVKVEQTLINTPNHIMWTHFNGAMLFRKPYWDMGFDYNQVKSLSCIFLSRNFYSTIASVYDHGKHRKQIFDLNPKAFLRNPRYGIGKLLAFYNQINEVHGLCGNFTAFQYEKILKNPREQFIEILHAFNQPVNEQFVDEVVESGQLLNMQETAAQSRYANTWLGEINPNAKENKNVTIGNNKKYHALFDDDDLDYIKKMIDMVLVNKDASYLEGCLTPPPINKK